MDEELQETMVRSKFYNIFLKLKIEENKLAYVRHCNYCVKLLRQKKRQHFNNINLSSVADNEVIYRKNSLLYLLEKKVSSNSKMTLVERNKVLIDDAKIAQTFSTFFGNIVDTLNIERNKSIF